MPSGNRGLGRHDRGLAAGTAVRDAHHAARRSLQLLVTVASSAAVMGSRTALSSQSTEPPPIRERAAHKADETHPHCTSRQLPDTPP